MIYISLALGSAIFIAILIRIAVKSKDFSACVSQVLIGVWLMEIVLILPIFLKTYSAVPALISSFLYGLKCLAGRQSIDLIFESGLNGVPKLLYHSLHYIAFVAAPVVTSSLIISFFGDASDRIRYWLTFRTTCHVFSELNDEAIALADSIKNKNENNIVVFCNTKNINNVQKKQARNIEAILLHTTSDKFKILRRYRKISFYQINRDEDENINNSLLLIKNHREIDCKGSESEGIMIFAFISSYTKTQILESVDYGHLKVYIVNVTLLTCYNQLKKVTLYQNCRENNIVSALIVGAGDTGLEFLKAICWCGQILDCGLEINVFDKDAVKIEKEFFAACPELHLDEYAIRFVSSDATCTDFEEKLNAHCKNTSYAVLAMTDDDLNIDTALYLRGYFLRSNLEAVRDPVINARVRNTMKNEHLFFISNKNINLFGSLDDTYSIDKIVDSKIEQMAKSIHSYYSLPHDNKLDEKTKKEAMKDYYGKEYNRRSSMANALHIQYKLFSCDVMKAHENKLTFTHSEEYHSKISANAELKTRLAKLEHRRWNAFMRSIGYRSIEASKIHYYTQKGQKKSYINTVALLHPCLVEWDELENVSKVVSEATGCPVDFVNADYTMVEAVPIIINQILKDEDEKQIEVVGCRGWRSCKG